MGSGDTFPVTYPTAAAQPYKVEVRPRLNVDFGQTSEPSYNVECTEPPFWVAHSSVLNAIARNFFALVTMASADAKSTSTPRVRYYREFLTPALHRRFVKAAGILLVVCFVEGVLTRNWSSSEPPACLLLLELPRANALPSLLAPLSTWPYGHLRSSSLPIRSRDIPSTSHAPPLWQAYYAVTCKHFQSGFSQRRSGRDPDILRSFGLVVQRGLHMDHSGRIPLDCGRPVR